MPSVNYYNQSANFWDWVASMEEQGQNHPMFGNRGQQTNRENGNNEGPNPWTQGAPAFPFGGPFAHRGRGGAPPPFDSLFPQTQAEEQTDTNNEKDGGAGPSGEADAPPPPPEDGPSRHDPGSRRGRGWGARGHGPSPRCARGGPARGHHHGHHGHHGPRGFPPMMGGFGALANMFQEQMFGNDTTNKDQNEDFKPEVDVFDTAEAFVVHVSLPGAKKEDVGVNWDAEKSELSIAGVVYRPGDEEFLQTLAMNERKIGAFERKVRLGSRANPAAVDVDGIHAKMEDGVLTVEVPKLDSGYVEIKKVDIE